MRLGRNGADALMEAIGEWDDPSKKELEDQDQNHIDRIFGLEIIHSSFSEKLSEDFSRFVNKKSYCSVSRTEIFKYGECFKYINFPILFCKFKFGEMPGGGFFQMDPKLAHKIFLSHFDLVDDVEENHSSFSFNKNTLKILNKYFKKILKSYEKSWNIIIPDFSFSEERRMETNPSFLHIAELNETVVSVEFDVEFDNNPKLYFFKVCFPFSSIEEIRIQLADASNIF